MLPKLFKNLRIVKEKKNMSHSYKYIPMEIDFNGLNTQKTGMCEW